MSIKDFLQKIKLFFLDIQDKIYSKEKGLKIKSDLYIVILIMLMSIASFGLGRLSAYESKIGPIITTDNDINTATATITQTNTTSKGIVFSSKSGTKYYYPTCSLGNRISVGNRVWFQTIADAESAGLTLANGCK
jgi:hypothetical protein